MIQVDIEKVYEDVNYMGFLQLTSRKIYTLGGKSISLVTYNRGVSKQLQELVR